MKRLSITVLIIAALAPITAITATFEVREYDGMPCMWQNQLPYFGRFEHTQRKTIDLAGSWRFRPDPDDRGETSGFYQPGFDDGA